METIADGVLIKATHIETAGNMSKELFQFKDFINREFSGLKRKKIRKIIAINQFVFIEQLKTKRLKT